MDHIDIYSGDKVISHIVAADGLGDLKTCLLPYAHIFVLVDSHFAAKSPRWSGLQELFSELGTEIMHVEASEEVKTLETVMEICTWLLDKGADRNVLLLAVGGGITTDMAGFAASIYKRGVRFAYMPTTLLSQVDAAIGGKTGVNFEKYKNILGVIRQPEFTYLCPQVLESLPQRDFLSGAAEMLKTFIIEDGGNYPKAVSLISDMLQSSAKNGRMVSMVASGDSWTSFEDVSQNNRALSEDGCNDSQTSAGETGWQEALRMNMDGLSALIAAAARVKAGVVSRDQFEKGERRKLNLGHTFAHAIETLAQREAGQNTCPTANGEAGHGITHGEAVAMGMVLAARLADRYYGAGHSAVEARIREDLQACNMPVLCPYSVDEMAQIMTKDKKAEGGKVHFVLPKAIGDVETVSLSVDEVCRLLKDNK